MKLKMKNKTIALRLITAGVLLLSACTVGPDYIPPEMPEPEAWHSQLKDGLTDRTSEQETLTHWWTTFNDPVLNDLIKKSVEGNLNLKQAQSKLREARAARGVSQSELFPTIGASGSATRSRTSENSNTGMEVDLYRAGFDAGWEIDIFGGVRRSVEASTADLQAAEASLQNVFVSLMAETALNYVELRTFQTRLDVAEANLKAQQETFILIKSRREAGLSDELSVQQARYNLENTRSQIPGLRSNIEANKNRIAILTGRTPGALEGMLNIHQPIPVTPPAVAVGAPAETLRRRPDVRLAEKELAAQTARIGVAEADLYPKFKLFGTIGLESIDSADLFQSASRFYSWGPSISWNIFRGGAIRKNIQVQTERQNQALLVYEATILKALGEVENALTAYAEEQLRRERLLEAVDAAQKAESLAQAKYKAGLVEFSNVLDAQRSLLSFEDALAQSDGAVTSNLISLYKALGGGWTNMRPEEKINNDQATADQNDG